MIGNNLGTDIPGARNSGLDQYFFNPGKKERGNVTYEISELIELKGLL